MKSILMKPHLVAQTFAGNKTQTRRVIKKLNSSHRFYGATLDGYYFSTVDKEGCTDFKKTLVKPKYSVGETIYVKEAFEIISSYSHNMSHFQIETRYPDKSSLDHIVTNEKFEKYYDKGCKKYSPLFMPEIFARLFLKIKDVRVERLQDISEEDAIEEGVERFSDGTYKDYTPGGNTGVTTARQSFRTLWESIHGEDPLQNWDANPWVFVYDFGAWCSPEKFGYLAK